MQDRWDRYVKDHPRERTSPWNAIMPWLKWGVYALVETEKTAIRNNTQTRELLPLGWQDEFRFDAGYLRSTNPATVGDATRDRLHSNYLVFSLVPGQIAEDGDVLRAASKATDSFLIEIRQSDTSAQSAVMSANALAQTIALRVIQSKADEIGRKAATAAEGAIAPRADFAKRFQDDRKAFWDAIRNSAPPAISEKDFDTVMEVAKAKWESRLRTVLGLMTDPKSTDQRPNQATPPPNNSPS